VNKGDKSMLVEIDDKFITELGEFYAAGRERFKDELKYIFKYKENYFTVYRDITYAIKEQLTSNFIDDDILRGKVIILSNILLQQIEKGIKDFEENLEDLGIDYDEKDLIFNDSNWSVEFIQQEISKLFSDVIGFNRLSKNIAKRLYEDLKIVQLKMRIEKRLEVNIEDIIEENKELKSKLKKVQDFMLKKNREVMEYLYEL